jgi:O-antigen ligase
MGEAAGGSTASGLLNRERLMRAADWLAVALAVSLPWSTSAASICAALLLVVLIPTLDLASIRRVLLNPAGGLPALLWLLGVVGMLWAFDLPLKERYDGLKSFHKLLYIPLLMLHFSRSERAAWVMNGFLASCSAMLVVSWAIYLKPSLPWPWIGSGGRPGIPVRDYIAQSAEFTICVMLLAGLVLKFWHERRRQIAIATTLLALIFLANVFFVAASRTSLVVTPVLVLLFAFKKLPWKAIVPLLIAAIASAAIAWAFATETRHTITTLMGELRDFKPDAKRSRSGERLEFWRKSIGFVESAPVIGHGTGSIRDQFRKSAVGQTGMAALAAHNPHNQTLAVAVQLGLIGTAVLFAMWLAHLLLFRGEGMAAWAGLVIVAQNVVGSLFNSHLFDFSQGWTYVIGVGVAAGALLRHAPVPQPAPATGSDQNSRL